MGQIPVPEKGASAPREAGASGGSAAARILRLLCDAYVSCRSGHLHLAHGQERRGLAIREGQIIQGRSDVAGEHLGDVLVRHGLLSQQALEQAVATVLSDRRPLGVLLLERSLIDRDRLEEAVGWHVREILFAALERTGGSCSFEELGRLPEDFVEGDLVSRLPTGQMLLEAARRVRDAAVVREALGDVDRKLTLPADPRLHSQQLALTPADGFVLSRVDGTLSARELIALGPLPPAEAERSLLGLVCAGAVVPVTPRAPRAAVRPVAPSPPPPKSGAPTNRAAATASAPPPPEAAAPPASPPASVSPARSPEEVRRLILDAYGGLVQSDHFELLGVSRDASADEIRLAYARLARSLHPDACRDPLLADVDAQREAVFLRVRRAYEILRDPEARAAYERDNVRRKPRPSRREGPAVTFSSSVPAETPLPSAAAPPLPAAAETPPPSAAPVPPPEPMPPPEAARPAEPARPVEKPRPPEPSAPPPSLEERLAATIGTGEDLVQAGHYWEAIQTLEPTLVQARGALRIRARLALARACLKNPKWGKRAEAHLQDVLLEDPLRIEAYLLLGGLYRESKLHARAIAMYRRVLDLQPSHRAARRQLAELERAEAPPRGRGSLLGFLKKR